MEIPKDAKCPFAFSVKASLKFNFANNGHVLANFETKMQFLANLRFRKTSSSTLRFKFLIVSNFEALSKIMQMKRGILDPGDSH